MGASDTRRQRRRRGAPEERAAEKEERDFYAGKAGTRWLDDLAPLGTDSDKPFLETAPYLIVVFRVDRELPLVGSGEQERRDGGW